MRYESIQQACEEIGTWQELTFSKGDELARGSVNKLKSEAEELALALFRNGYRYSGDPSVKDEIADVGVLLFGLAHTLGIDIGHAIFEKMERNKARKWGQKQADGSFQHVE